MMKLILMLVAAFMTAVMVKCHKKRKREDVVPSEHIFAEQYYSVQNSSD